MPLHTHTPATNPVYHTTWSYLSQMELKRQGTLFRLCDRLSKWVLGIYVPQDFQGPTSSDEAIVRRKTLREELLRRIVTEEDGTFVKTTNWEIPTGGRLEKRSNPGNTKEDDVGGRVPAPTPTALRSPKHALLENDDDIEEVQATQSLGEQSQSSETRHTEDATKEQGRQRPGNMLRLLSHDGTEFQMPKEVGTLLVELIARVRLMEERLADHQR